MLYIRTDMNPTISTGHMMRCLAIADALSVKGEKVTFLLADTNAVNLLEKRGYLYRVLSTDWKDMESELPQLEGVLRQESIPRILVDSYQVTPRYLSCLQEMAWTAYIDDVNAFIYPVDGLICYANYWEKFGYRKRYSKTELCLGMEYVPLREVFASCPAKNISRQIERVLLLSGGSDPYDMIRRILHAIVDRKETEIHVICGKYYPYYEEVCRDYSEQKNIVFHRAVSNMEDYMKMADIAVSAGGTTLYELCACGTPTISYSMADNQLDNVRQFAEDGLIPYAGDAREALTEEKIAAILKQYGEQRMLRVEQSHRMQQMVDGNGAGRIADWLCRER